MKGFQLQKPEDGRTRQQTGDIELESIRSSIIDSILIRLSERFECDEEIVKLIEPFVSLNPGADLRKIHKQFASDLDLASIQLQYNELIDQKMSQKFNGKLDGIIKILVKDSKNLANYKEVAIIFARIQACTPHSSDVERSISANNRSKTPLRNRIALETEVKYLYVHFNLWFVQFTHDNIH